VLRRVQKYIETEQLLQRGDRVLVCVSGGADSVALLDVLHLAGYDCVVAHCNFHLRGEESMRDERFVRTLCQTIQVPLFVSDFDTVQYATSHSVSIEMAARELRYRWFAELAAEQHCVAIAVAHHQNDQAETLLLNLKRGTGIRGLCGMRPLSVNPIVSNSVPIIRPLLCTTRDYIEYYLQSKRHLNWVVDSTNQDTSIARNAIRHELSQYSKSEIENIASTARYMQGYTDMMDQKNTREARYVQFYEQIRTYNFPEPNKIYDALQRGVGGKVFTAPKYIGVIQHKQLLITPRMRHFGIIGYPLGHSFSARYFTEKFATEQIPADYSLFPLAEDTFTNQGRENATLRHLIDTLDGMNVTIPYKETVIPYLDRLDDTAQQIGAVNVIYQHVGYNTDCIGFMHSIRPLLLPTDKYALVLGTGGAAKAVVYGLHRLGIETTLVSRSPKNERMLSYQQIDQDVLTKYSVLVNCTPLGMYPNIDTCPAIPYHLLNQRHLLFDCVYNPEETLFLRNGRQQGTRTKNGLDMLYGQAEAAWKIWNSNPVRISL